MRRHSSRNVATLGQRRLIAFWEILGRVDEHNLAKVGVVGSNPIARSKNSLNYKPLYRQPGAGCFPSLFGEAGGKQTERKCALARLWKVRPMNRPMRRGRG